VTTAARGLAWVAVALLALVWLAQPGGVLAPAPAVAGAALEVSGDVGDLPVGGEGRLVVTVRNPLGDDVVVRRLSARAAGEQECLTVVPWEGALPVPAHGAASADLRVAVAADPTCAGRSWQLVLTAAT
jgi:hypothetical protein